jgi:large subunit ribosomal protein L4
MDAKIYNQQGKESGKVTLPDAVFATQWNADLVHQVATAMMSNARDPIAHTKTRGEVRGGGKKPWQQKGLGRARHGSSRSPIWVGGGVAHGPRNDKNYSKKINKKMKTAALYSILSKKFKDKEIFFLDTLSFKAPKAKDAQGVLTSISTVKGFEKLAGKKKNSAFIAVPAKDRMVEKSFGNFGNVEVGEIRNMNPLHVLNYKYLVIANPEASLKQLA